MEKEKKERKTGKKADNKGATEFNQYEREDLVWEAVRRNEEYKKFYSDSIKNNYSYDKEEICFGATSNRWNMAEDFVVNPDKTAEEIRKEIINGADPIKVHPYHFMFKICRHFRIDPIDPVINETENGMYEVNEDSAVRLKYIRKHSKRLIPIWVAPWADEDEIKVEVVKIMRPLRELYNEEYDRYTEQENIASCNSKSIGKSIEALKRYDEIVKDFKKRGLSELDIKEKKLSELEISKLHPKDRRLDKSDIIDGYYNVIPKLVSKEDIIPLKIYKPLLEDEIENVMKKYMKAYNDSILLIKHAPDIVFKAARLSSIEKDIKYGSKQIPMPTIKNFRKP